MKFVFLFSVLALLFLAGCTQSVDEVKNEDNVGEQVRVRGVVDSSIKIGDLSGYMVVDENDDSIAVSSSDLPDEGENVVVSGVLMRDTVFDYYIQE